MTMQRKMLVTSALPYANGPLHLGHLVGYIQADIWVRLHKMLGMDCRYVCGSDAHGTPIMIQAEKQGLSPEAMVSAISTSHKQDFARFHVDFDYFGSTHSQQNQNLVETIFKRHQDQGNIVKKTIKQLYDPIKQMFLPDRYIKGQCPQCKALDQYGDNCEICGTTYQATDLINPYSTLSGSTPIEKESDHYFFQLKKFESFLKQWTRMDHLQAEVSNKLDEWFTDGLREWDISRDKPYFGFLIPGENDKYFYVWLDAPIGYMANFQSLCEQDPKLNFDEYFGKNSEVELYHFIGKDIIYFHALFWPALLYGANFRTPTAIFANGFLTINGQKMSKSRGTFIRAQTYLDHLHPDYLRYYFTAKLTHKLEDIDLNFDDFAARINADLIGKLINIASRCASFINKNFNSHLSATCAEPALFNEFSATSDTIATHFKKLEYSQAIRKIMALADKANQYIDEQKPWSLIKDPTQHKNTHDICTMGLNLFRILMIYLKPVLPETAKQVEQFFNIAPLMWQDSQSCLLNHKINSFKALLTRIDPKQMEALKMAAQEDINTTQNTKTNSEPTSSDAKDNYITIDDFNKIDLRVAKIIEANHVEGADKLLQIKVELDGNTKQVFAGIKSAYTPEALVGKHVVMVANLAPRKMRFGLSEGMILCAGDGQELFIISPEPGAKSGMKVK